MKKYKYTIYMKGEVTVEFVGNMEINRDEWNPNFLHITIKESEPYVEFLKVEDIVAITKEELKV